MSAPLPRVKCQRTRGLLARAQDQGFTIRLTGTNHLRIYAPDGTWAAGCSSTTGDRKSYLPLRASLRRAGYVGV